MGEIRVQLAIFCSQHLQTVKMFLDRLMRVLHPIGATASNITVVIERQMTYNKRFSAINSMIETSVQALMLERAMRCT
jgi:hypothetical protein